MKMISSDSNRRTFAFISLGCPKNLVDSERMLGKLAQDGYVLQPDAQGADVVVVNTCGFIEPARQESLAVIREMLELKQQGKIGSVVVAGCLAEDSAGCFSNRCRRSIRLSESLDGKRSSKFSTEPPRTSRNNDRSFGRPPCVLRKILLDSASRPGILPT